MSTFEGISHKGSQTCVDQHNESADAHPANKRSHLQQHHILILAVVQRRAGKAEQLGSIAKPVHQHPEQGHHDEAWQSPAGARVRKCVRVGAGGLIFGGTDAPGQKATS